MSLNPFHLALPSHNLSLARDFYVNLLSCSEGRSAERWLDLNFFGHQVSLHLVEDCFDKVKTNSVDGDKVPSRHFGGILDWKDWQGLSQKLKSINSSFLIEPKIRFKGESGEQATFFIEDPSGNALEFKSFKDPAYIFRK